jgi:hypothetical protein
MDEEYTAKATQILSGIESLFSVLLETWCAELRLSRPPRHAADRIPPRAAHSRRTVGASAVISIILVG